MRNRTLEWEPKTPWRFAAERSEAVISDLQFPFWCGILELVRTHFAAPPRRGEHPRQKVSGAAEPHHQQ